MAILGRIIRQLAVLLSCVRTPKSPTPGPLQPPAPPTHDDSPRSTSNDNPSPRAGGLVRADPGVSRCPLFLPATTPPVSTGSLLPNTPAAMCTPARSSFPVPLFPVAIEEPPQEPEEQMGDETYSSTLDETPPLAIEFEHADTPSPVQLERTVRICSDHLLGTVSVANIAYHKEAYVRWTRNHWESYTDSPASYQSSNAHNNRDTFAFQLPIADAQIECCIIYNVAGETYYDNNHGQNYIL